MTEVRVTKRDGRVEALEIDKIHRILEWACEDITNVSVSEIELAAQLQLYDKIPTSIIHETLIKSSADLISEDTPNYQYVAGRLVNYQLRKEVYDQYEPKHLLDLYNVGRDEKYYDSELGEKYSEDEFDLFNSYINHERDYLLSFAGAEQLRNKYLVKNRITGKKYETPQIAFMLIAMTAFQNYTTDRIKWVKDLYDALSTFDISFPTPIMAGLRTPQRQFSSCILIESGDSLDSINAAASAIVRYVSQRAGIGIGAGRIRAFGSPVRAGDTTHTGVIPFYRYFNSAVSSCSQGALRDGKATLHYPIWHLEVEDLLVLKNNKGTEESRVRGLDYSVQFNRVMYERLIEGGNITLFCPNDVPDLYNAFFEDTEKFRELYEKYERSTKIRKKKIPALELFASFVQERKDTGRIYLMNVDNVNEYGPFIPELAPIKQSNLCQEIAIPGKPLQYIDDPMGEIGVCTLAAINWGKIKTPSDIEKPAILAVRALNEILDYQNYPVPAAKTSTMKYRPLGVGIINFAFWMVKNGSSYKDPNLELLHEYAEAQQYYLLKASADLAKEQGRRATGFDNSKYSLGLLPIDYYKKDVDELVDPVYKQDWESLREQISETGILNILTGGLMPAETSAAVSNSTNGIEQPRALVSIKQSKDGVVKQVVPGIHKYKNKYELLWSDNYIEGYLKICAVLQKFTDQCISVNTTYNPTLMPDGEISAMELIQHILMHYKYGGKTAYYFNTYDGAGELEDEENCEGCVI